MLALISIRHFFMHPGATILSDGSSEAVNVKFIIHEEKGEKWLEIGTQTLEPCMPIETQGEFTLSSTIYVEEEQVTYEVRQIGAKAFNGVQLTTIHIQANIKLIKESAFADMPNLQTILFTGDNIINTVIPAYCFYRSKKLETISGLPPITGIEEYGFAGTAISEINLSSCVFLKECCFAECSSLGPVDMELSEIIDIPKKSFYGCLLIGTKFKIPSKLQVIGESAFEKSGISSFNGNHVLSEIGDRAFADSFLESVSLKYSLVSTIGSYAFSTQTLRSFTASPELATIGAGAFYGTNIQEFSITPTLEKHDIIISESAFENNKELMVADLGKTYARKIAAKCFQGCTELNVLIPPKGIEIIGEYAFSSTGKIVNMVFESSLYSIDSNAFENSGIEDLDFSETEVDSILQATFKNCVNLKKVLLPPKLVSIYDEAFFHTEQLSKIVFSESLAYIGPNAFKESAIESIELSATNITELGDSCFSTCKSCTTLELPTKLKIIPYNAFEYIGISKLFFPPNINRCKEYTFQYSANLEFADLSQSTIHAIYGYMFYECKKLSTIWIPSTCFKFHKYALKGSGVKNFTMQNVDYFGDDAMMECTELETVDFSTSVVPYFIPKYTFYGCTKLHTVLFGEVGDYLTFKCFARTPSLKKLEFKTTHFSVIRESVFEEWGIEYLDLSKTQLTQIWIKAFYKCSNLKTLLLPETLKDIRTEAFAYSGIEKFTVGPNVTSIASRILAFSNCSVLDLRVMTFNAFKLEEFSRMSNLKTIIWPEKTNFILNNNTFLSCTGVNHLVLPETLIETGDGSFRGMQYLLYCDMSKAPLTKISTNLFAGNYRMEIIVLPPTAQTIEPGAFIVIWNLTSLYYEGNSTFSDVAFPSTFANATFYVSENYSSDKIFNSTKNVIIYDFNIPIPVPGEEETSSIIYTPSESEEMDITSPEVEETSSLEGESFEEPSSSVEPSSDNSDMNTETDTSKAEKKTASNGEDKEEEDDDDDDEIGWEVLTGSIVGIIVFIAATAIVVCFAMWRKKRSFADSESLINPDERVELSTWILENDTSLRSFADPSNGRVFWNDYIADKPLDTNLDDYMGLDDLEI